MTTPQTRGPVAALVPGRERNRDLRAALFPSLGCQGGVRGEWKREILHPLSLYPSLVPGREQKSKLPASRVPGRERNRKLPFALAATSLLLFAAVSCGRKPNPDVISASGTIEARDVQVAAKVGGQVREVPVEEGARVRSGDVLAVLDHDALDIQLRQAEAGVALADAQLALLRQGARREDIAQARAQVDQAEASLRVAEDDARRMRALAAQGSVTVKQRDDAEARLTAAQAQAAAAREGLKKSESFTRPEELTAAQARRDQAAAAADLIRKSIADSTVTSPVGGFVTVKAVEPGDSVAPGSTVATVTELDRVHVMIYVSEVELGRVRLGERAEVRVDSFPGRVFPGRVTFISPEAEFTPKNVQTKEDRVKLVFGVKVELDNPEGLLKPGLPADAVLRPAGAPAAK